MSLALADHLGWDRFSLDRALHGRLGRPARGRRRTRAGAPPGRRIAGARKRACRCRPSSGSCSRRPPSCRRTAAIIFDITTGGNRPAAWLDRMVRQSFETSDSKAFRAWLDSFGREDFHAELEGCEMPALAVAGELDPALSAELMRQTWMRWFVRGELVDWSGPATTRWTRPRSPSSAPSRTSCARTRPSPVGRRASTMADRTTDVPDIFDPRRYASGLPHARLPGAARAPPGGVAGRVRGPRLARGPRLLGGRPGMRTSYAYSRTPPPTPRTWAPPRSATPTRTTCRSSGA